VVVVNETVMGLLTAEKVGVKSLNKKISSCVAMIVWIIELHHMSDVLGESGGKYKGKRRCVFRRF